MAYADMLGLKQLEPAVFKAALAIEAQASLLAPVDQGALRNSISIATELREAGFNDEAGDKAPDNAKISAPDLGDGSTAYVGTGIEYGAAVEFGRPDLPNYPAQPYLRPAAMIVKAKISGEFTKEMKKSIQEWSASQRYAIRQKNMELNAGQNIE